MVKARKYVVKKHFQGPPKKTDYEIIETELPALKSGEILVKAEFISVDPYIRAYNNRSSVPYDQYSFQVGIVQESQHKGFAVGDRVVSHKGWVNYYIANPDDQNESPGYNIYKLPDLGNLPKSLGVGAIGMPGVSAYYGFLDVCKPKAGETVVISGAAGAVGSLKPLKPFIHCDCEYMYKFKMPRNYLRKAPDRCIVTDEQLEADKLLLIKVISYFDLR